jgi:protein kinase X
MMASSTNGSGDGGSSKGVRMSNGRAMASSIKGLDDLELLKTIGTGTFARVYLCRNRTNGTNGYAALKILSKHDVIRLKQVEHVNNEKEILSEIKHPFLIELLWFHKDDSFLYLMFPYESGGELFSYLRTTGRFSINTAQFYTAEIISALEYLHSLSVVYRDLKVENVRRTTSVFHNCAGVNWMV